MNSWDANQIAAVNIKRRRYKDVTHEALLEYHMHKYVQPIS